MTVHYSDPNTVVIRRAFAEAIETLLGHIEAGAKAGPTTRQLAVRMQEHLRDALRAQPAPALTPDPLRDSRSAFEDGLKEAKRRLSVAGMHDGKCPEPKQPCTCGLDKAIDTEPAGGIEAVPVFGVDREPVGHRWPDELPPPVHYLLPDGYCEECGGGCLIGFGNRRPLSGEEAK